MKETPLKTILIAFVLCIVCSVLVSTTAVQLKPLQGINRERDIKKNILLAAGLFQEGVPVDDQFTKIETVVVDFSTGETTQVVEAKTYDQLKAAKDPQLSEEIPRASDSGNLGRREKYSKVYLLREGGEIKEIILPVYGKGLWSTMYGFLALEKDTRTVKGFAYYSHGETPGLGGEVDSPSWKQQWVGKKVLDENFNPSFALAKGTVDHTHSLAQYRVDGLSGATITANGVTGSINYWLGDHAYAKFLANIREGKI